MGESREPQRRPAGIRIVGILLALGLLWHGYASVAVSVTARTPAALDRIPAGAWVRDYALPVFRQDWMVFAPTPGNADSTLRVRARLTDGSRTGWFNITEADIARSIRGRLVPSRMYLANFKAVSWYRTSFENLPEGMQAVLSREFTGKRWADRLERQLLSAQAEADRQAIREHLRHERALTALAAAVVRARHEPGAASPEAVQIMIVTVPVTPYSERENPRYQPDTAVLRPGWRPMVETEGLEPGVLEQMYGTGRP
jgi:hypothetical protein